MDYKDLQKIVDKKPGLRLKVDVDGSIRIQADAFTFMHDLFKQMLNKIL